MPKNKQSLSTNKQSLSINKQSLSLAKDRDKQNIKSITNFLFEVGTLRKVIRAHRSALLTDDLSDNIASHSFRVAILGYFLAREEKADVNKVIKMCLIHDFDESRSNDLNWVHKKFVKVYDDEIKESQLSFLPKDDELKLIATEYSKRESKEAKVAKDADLLDQLFLLREYEWQGNKEASIWLQHGHQDKLLTTKTAREIAIQLRKQNPSDWWNNLWTSKRR